MTSIESISYRREGGVSKKIVEYHISRLSNKDSAVRLKAIQELELLCDDDAMAALQEIYENDPDDTVRLAAKQAGREIFRNNLKNSDKS